MKIQHLPEGEKKTGFFTLFCPFNILKLNSFEGGKKRKML